MQSLPFVGAWIEIVRCIERYPKYMSLPSRERGLKWFSLPDHNQGLPSLEHRLKWKNFIWEKYLQKIQIVGSCII